MEHSLWYRIIGWFVDRKLVVLLLGLLLIAAGIYVAPFDYGEWEFERERVAVDAIPDIGENQQIVFSQWDGRSPRDVEDQITYPLTSALLGIPGVRTVRSTSAFGFSTIYVIFNDDVEFYWSRSRVLEKLASLPAGTVPPDVQPTLGPDATALGQIYWYTLEGRSSEGEVVGGWDLDELRSTQDWSIRYALQSVPGVSEVASIGGFVREYQIDVDPVALRAQGVTLSQVANAVRHSNLDVGARTLEINRVEYIVRGLGFIESVDDIEETVVVTRGHTPIRIRDVARVGPGPALRRGALDDAGAPAVGGVVVARYMENPMEVISAVKEKIRAIQPGLPRRTLDDGTSSQVTIVPFYDRTQLINETLSTLSTALYQQILVTIIVVLIMLQNLRASALISSMLPLGVLVAFICMKLTGVDANIMALGGIAIAIGTMVDISIVFVENINASLESMGAPLPHQQSSARIKAVKLAAAEVAPAVFTSVLTTVVSFLPVFGLSSTELRLFAPLAFTKTFAMAGALVLALTLLPALALIVFRVRPSSAPVASSLTRSQRWRASVFRIEHIRDWILTAAGLALIVFLVSPVGGIAVVALGLFRLARPMLSRDTVKRWTRWELWVTTILVAALLTLDWMPLGQEIGVIGNIVFVAIPIGGTMLGFRAFERVYPSALAWVLANKRLFLVAPGLILFFGLSAWVGTESLLGFLPSRVNQSRPMAALHKTFPGFGREYMPTFDEGSFLYMPTTMPHASMGEVLEALSALDAAIATIPEVDRVVGKLGRINSALDPAPISMIETLITYHPEYRVKEDGSRTRLWREEIVSPKDIWDEILRVAERPGLTSAPVLMPINARIVMLQSGMRAPMGIKVTGPTLGSIESFGLALEEHLSKEQALRSETVFADRVVGKPYLEIEIDREAIGRYGLSVVDVQQTLQVALGGMPLTNTVEGRERYPVRVRYMRETRDSVENISNIFVSTPSGEQIPLSQLSTVRYVRGPQMIRSEDTFLTSYVLFDKKEGVSEVEAVEKAQESIEQAIADGTLILPDGVSYAFAGSYQNQLRSEQRLMLLLPVALIFVFILLYLQFSKASVVGAIYSGVAVAVAGGFVLLWLYAQPWFLDGQVFGTSLRDLFQVGTVNLSVAVWVGVIALIGIATDDGVVMATYLQQRFKAEPPTTIAEVRERTSEAGSRRVRPCLMTTATTILALLPVITSQGRGFDIMVPMALPAMGGMIIELVTLFVVPVLFCALEERRIEKGTPQ